MLVQTLKDYQQVLRLLSETKAPIYIDCETSGLKPYHGDFMVGIAIKAKGTKSYYLPFRHKAGTNLPESSISLLGPLLADPDRTFINWNIGFDMHFLEKDGIPIKGKILDAMLGWHLYDENAQQFALKYIGKTVFGGKWGVAEDDLLAIVGSKELMYLYPPEVVEPYAITDVDLVDVIEDFLTPELAKQGLIKIWHEIGDYVRVTQEMERNGLLVDRDLIDQSRISTIQAQAHLLQTMRDDTGLPLFNPNSYLQVRKVLDVSETHREALELMSSPLSDDILNYRRFTKAIGSYYEPLLTKTATDGRIHCNVKLHGTVSGRPSVINPNMQALPREDEFWNVRQGIIAEPGHVLVSLDWNQAELRLLACFAKVKFLIDAYLSGEDVHQMTADALTIPRDHAKRINFGQAYKITPFGLARQLRITEREAHAIAVAYHQRMPEISKFTNALEQIADRDREIRMWTGRKKRYPRKYATSKASSNYIQGGVAEIMRISLVKFGRRKLPSSKLLIQVHDEILFQAPEDSWYDEARVCKKCMEAFDFGFGVPMLSECKVGTDWGKMKKVEFK
jgi:DNA polymerase I